MSEEPIEQNFVMFVLAAHELAKECARRGSTPEATQKLEQYIDQGPNPPWNMLMHFPFAVLDSALAHFVDGIPGFLEQRSKATGVTHTATLKRTQVSVGSSRIIMQLYALGEESTLTMHTRAMMNDRTLLFAKVEPLTPLGKIQIVQWLGSFLDWFYREQRTWQETEVEEATKEQVVILPDGSLYTEDPTIYIAYNQHPIDEALDWRDAEKAAGRKQPTLQAAAERSGYGIDAVKQRNRKRETKHYTKIHQNTPKSKPTNDK